MFDMWREPGRKRKLGKANSRTKREVRLSVEWNNVSELCTDCIHEKVCSKKANCDDFFPKDARPVVHAEWLKHQEIQYMGQIYVEWSCSNCGRIGKRAWSTKSRNYDVPPVANYCAKCGARMENKL